MLWQGVALFVGKIAEYTQRVRPWSLASISLALVGLAIAAVVRDAFTRIGANLYFAPFYPVVLTCSLFLGIPAGLIVTLLTPFIVWWAFIPPAFDFTPPTATDLSNFLMFGISALMIVGLSHLYRVVVRSLVEEQKAKELLIRELNHRSGNLLTVVQSIVRGSLINDREEAQRLARRIAALAEAEKLSATDPEGFVALSAMLGRELSAYPPLVVSYGGPDVLLSGAAARYLGLVLHELTTNSAKYGALSKDNGRLEVRWSAAGENCCVRWTETGVGRPSDAPRRVGFGSRMIQASLETISGSIESDFTEDGFSCVLNFASGRTVQPPRETTSPTVERQKVAGPDA